MGSLFGGAPEAPAPAPPPPRIEQPPKVTEQKSSDGDQLDQATRSDKRRRVARARGLVLLDPGGNNVTGSSGLTGI